MIRTTIPLLLAALSVIRAAEPVPPPAPVRDPMGSTPEAAPMVVSAGAVPVVAAPVARLRLPLVEAIGRSGSLAVAVFSLDTRRVVVTAGSDFVLDQERFTFVACENEDVRIRNRAGQEIRLQVMTPANTAAAKPADVNLPDTTGMPGSSDAP